MESVIVRPRYLSICAADQRYFQGNRPLEVLKKKLPLALFHECLGEVLRDPAGKIPQGTLCVLLPGGIPSLQNDSNYAKGSFFRSSNADGFCQEVMCLDRREIIPVQGEEAWLYVFSELMSVCCQALHRLESIAKLPDNATVGIWGDGSLGFLMTLTLSQLKPTWKTIALGKHDEKLINISFAGARRNVADTCPIPPLDAAFECVGGSEAQFAIQQAVQALKSRSPLILMGVSEIPPVLPTRTILEKGLVLIGSSRSTGNDFAQAIELIGRGNVKNTLQKIVSARVVVHSAKDLINTFYEDRLAQYKTVIEVRF